MSAVVWKLLNTGTTLVASRAATSLVDKGWPIVTGRPVPLKTNYAKDQTRDLVIYTALSSMVIAAVKVAAERKAIDYYVESTGHLPKALAEPKLSRREKKLQKKAARLRQRSLQP